MTKSGNVGDFYLELIKQLENEGRIGTKMNYKNSYNSLKRFCNNDLDFSFADIPTSSMRHPTSFPRIFCQKVVE